MPLWLGAGLADWYIHRRTRIEDTAGARESMIHALMFAETGVPVLLGLFCEVNAGVLLTAYAAVDDRYRAGRAAADRRAA